MQRGSSEHRREPGVGDVENNMKSPAGRSLKAKLESYVNMDEENVEQWGRSGTSNTSTECDHVVDEVVRDVRDAVEENAYGKKC